VIVTSYAFRDGQIDYERLDLLKSLIGKEHLVRSASALFYWISLCHTRYRYSDRALCELTSIWIADEIDKVLDLSCRKKAEDGRFYVMTDRWQKFTSTSIE
jgi:phosphoribosylformimino-5-aminoimidazole carboxamide ribotide isomerase